MAILRCTSSFSAEVDGVPTTVAGGQLVDSNDPVVKGREHLFEQVDTFMARRRSTEEATAEPGEARTVSTAKRTRKTGDR